MISRLKNLELHNIFSVAINLLIELFYIDMPMLETDGRPGGRTVT